MDPFHLNLTHWTFKIMVLLSFFLSFNQMYEHFLTFLNTDSSEMSQKAKKRFPQRIKLGLLTL